MGPAKVAVATVCLQLPAWISPRVMNSFPRCRKTKPPSPMIEPSTSTTASRPSSGRRSPTGRLERERRERARGSPRGERALTAPLNFNLPGDQAAAECERRTCEPYACGVTLTDDQSPVRMQRCGAAVKPCDVRPMRRLRHRSSSLASLHCRLCVCFPRFPIVCSHLTPACAMQTCRHFE